MSEIYKRILAATDGTELAMRAIEQAAHIATAMNAELFIVTVTPPPPTFASGEMGWSVPTTVYDDIQAANVATAKKILETTSAALAHKPERTIHVEDREPFRGILEAADAVHADLIVMASHGRRGIDKLILGSQASKVLSLAHIPVLVVKQPT